VRVENTSHPSNHTETLKMSNIQRSRQHGQGWKRVPYKQHLEPCNFNSVIGVELEPCNFNSVIGVELEPCNFNSVIGVELEPCNFNSVIGVELESG
jgi:hypothetical protein